MYTIETLTQVNENNSNVLPIVQKDVDIVNGIIASLANNLTNPLPCAGDNVVMYGKNREGDVKYDRGHCEGLYYDKVKYNLCTRPSFPHIGLRRDGTGHSCDTSGGYWLGADGDKISDTGETTEKMFWTWGSRGIGGHMGIYFFATVKKMEYTDLENIY